MGQQSLPHTPTEQSRGPTQPVAVQVWKGPQHGLSGPLAAHCFALGHFSGGGGGGLHFPRAFRTQSMG